ncbi:MAG TPA: hypothetical protein HA263_08010 [Methanoregulaceae archaeon]|nr:hypothetical protein [Methanoregulaceae archaeon]
MSDSISESERQQIAETSRLSEAVRLLAGTVEKQGEKIDRVTETSIRTAQTVEGLTTAVTANGTKVDDLVTKLGECPCPAVSNLQTAVGDLKVTTAREAGKIAGAIGVIVTVLNLLAPHFLGRS